MIYKLCFWDMSGKLCLAAQILGSSKATTWLCSCWSVFRIMCAHEILSRNKTKKWFYKHLQIKSYTLYVDIWEAYVFWYFFTIH